MASKHLLPGQQNFTRLGLIYVDLNTLALKDILSCAIVPADLHNAIKACSTLNLRPEQIKLCCCVSPDYGKFDVTLLYTLIRNLCPAFKPTKGWGKTPSSTDTSIGDDIERLRIFRNEKYAHITSFSVTDTDFKSQKTDIEDTLRRVQTFIISKGNNVDYIKKIAEIEKKYIGSEEMGYYINVLKEAIDNKGKD
jgi:hypothetical protein